VFSRMLVIALATGSTMTTLVAEERALQDPMQPIVKVPAADGGRSARPGPQLTGVLISAKRRVAIIDGELYREGDAVGGLEIERIEANAVFLRRGNEAVAIHLSAEGKQAATNSGDPRS